MADLNPRQFGVRAQRKHTVTPPRTLYGDIIEARGKLQASNRTAGTDAETPPWLLRSHGG